MMNLNTLVSLLAYVVAFAVIFVAFYLKRKRNKSIFQEYDERQLIARANAYSTAFFVFLMLICADVMLKLIGIYWCEDPLGEFLALFITLIVFAWKSISSDAFLGRNEIQNKKNMLILYLAVGIADLAIAITSLDELFENGKVTIHAISLFTGITFLSIAVMLLIHDRRAKMEEEE